MLADGLSGQEVPHGVPDGRQPLQALHVDQEAPDAAAHVLLAAEGADTNVEPQRDAEVLFF